MINSSLEEALWKKLEEIVVDEGLKLYDVELSRGSLLRVTVFKGSLAGDKVAGDRVQAGVSSGECSGLCRRLSVYFAAQGEEFGVTEETAIEVCSPGVNRKLRLREHFRYALGERIKIEPDSLELKKKGRKATGPVFGILKIADENRVGILSGDTESLIELRYDEIKKARVDFKW